LISELKAENFELRNKERHYNEMYDNISGIERDCAVISEEKRVMEEEMRRRSDADGVTIRRLREQNEGLVLGNRDYDAKLAAIKDEIAHLRAVSDSKAREIADLNASIAVKTDDNLLLRDKTRDADHALVTTIKDIEVTDNIIRSRDHDIDDLNKRINRRVLEIDDRRGKIGAAETEMARLNDNITKARVDQDKLRCRLDDEVDRNNRFRADNEGLIAKGAALVANIRDVEAKCANRDAQINVMRDEIDKLKHSLAASDLDNRNLEEELAAMNKHGDILHHQNNLLNDELADALAGEDFVKRDKIAVVKHDNENQVRQSLNFLSGVKSRSPVRR